MNLATSQLMLSLSAPACKSFAAASSLLCMRTLSTTLPTLETSSTGASTSQQQQHQNQSIKAIRDRIFGAPISPHAKNGRKELAKKLQGQEIASWYFMPPTEQPGFHNEEREYVLQRNQNRRKKPEAGQEGAPAKAKGKK